MARFRMEDKKNGGYVLTKVSKTANELYKQYEIELDQYKSENVFFTAYAKSYDELYRMFGSNLKSIEEMPFSATDRDHLKCPEEIIYIHGVEKK